MDEDALKCLNLEMLIEAESFHKPVPNELTLAELEGEEADQVHISYVLVFIVISDAFYLFMSFTQLLVFELG